MSNWTTLLPLATTFTIIVMIPGPNALAVSTTAMRGRRAGLWMAIGVSTGDMVWAATALAGLGALLEHARPVFELLRWLGVAYLIVFAVRLWRQERDTRDGPETVDVAPAASARRTFGRGLLVDLSNPKAAMFFTTLFASILPGDLDAGLALGALAVVAAVAYGWYLLLAVALSQPRIQRGYRRASRPINRIASGVIGALGIKLALD